MPSSPEQVKAAQDKVKMLVKKGDYGGAIAILRALDHPSKQKWIDQVEARRSDREFSNALEEMPADRAPTKAKAAPVPTAKVGMERTFRWVWGILTLLACGWIVMGVSITRNAAAQVMATPVNTVGMTAEQAQSMNGAAIIGTGLGAGLGLTFFLCTGAPFFILFGILYWRNGVAIGNKRRHAETIAALRGQ